MLVDSINASIIEILELNIDDKDGDVGNNFKIIDSFSFIVSLSSYSTAQNILEQNGFVVLEVQKNYRLYGKNDSFVIFVDNREYFHGFVGQIK